MNRNEQLRILSIFHYVVGGLHALFGSFGLIHFFIGLSFVANPSIWNPPHAQNAPPAWFGWIFLIAGGGFVLFGWTLGVLTVLSGRYIAARKNRMFSIVVGAVNCALMPFGTVLGVFDIILLTNDEVKAIYPETGAHLPPPV